MAFHSTACSVLKSECVMCDLHEPMPKSRGMPICVGSCTAALEKAVTHSACTLKVQHECSVRGSLFVHRCGAHTASEWILAVTI